MKLIFQNSAILDPRSFTILGLSAKETKSPIGYFGTGLKYAIAVLLRTHHHIEILTDGSTYKFGITHIDFRGQPASLINVSINGAAPTDLGYTLELGKNWDVWQAYRELASNCKDEAGIIRLVPDTFTPSDTTITVTGAPIINEGYHKHSDIFIDSEPLFTCKHGSIHTHQGDAAYFKGVKVGHVPRASAFTYNVFSSVDLTEDRTIKYDFEYRAGCSAILAACSDPVLLNRAIYDGYSKAYEATFELENPHSAVTEHLYRVYQATPSALAFIHRNALEKAKGRQVTLRDYTPTPIELRRVTTLIEMFAKLDIKYPPISYCKTDNAMLMGFAGAEGIVLTNYGVARGLSDLAITMLEEYHHEIHKLDDFSRPYQDFLLRELINLYAEKTETVI